MDYFLKLFSACYKRDKKMLFCDAMRRLVQFDWFGNVRQLEHVLLNAWVLSDRPELDIDDIDLPDGRVIVRSFDQPESRSAEPSRRSRRSTLSQHRNDERERILKALQACNWNRVKAAEVSGIPRRTFYRRLREYGIQ